MENIKLVYFVCNKFKNCGIEYEDLVSIGTYGLLKAQKTFNNKFKFSTYAHICIRNEILCAIRNEKKYIRHKNDFVSSDAYTSDYDDINTSILYKQVIDSIPEKYKYLIPLLRKEKTINAVLKEYNIGKYKLRKDLKELKRRVNYGKKI